MTKNWESLVEQNIGLVYLLAGRWLKRVPDFVDRDDLVGWGSEGLVKAAQRFDASLGFKFSTFAGKHINGSIMDGLRGGHRRSTLERIHFESIDAHPEIRSQYRDRRPSPRHSAMASELWEIVSALPSKERIVTELRFRDDLAWGDVADRLGVTRQRVHQIWSRASWRLSKRLGKVGAAA